MSEAESSIFQSNLPIEAKLERARMELLDFSARNRLLNIPRFSKSAKTIDVVDEKSAEIYRLLVRDSRAFTFAAGRPDRVGGEAEDDEEDLSTLELAQPEDEIDERGVSRRHSDTKLQTRMTPKGLQKRLLDLYHDARTLEEEQGVNILFLALGLLKWIDPNNKDNVRHAPLVLVPVRLERGTAGEKFRLRARAEDQTSNLSLEAYLDRVHALTLPTLQAGDDFDPAAYLAGVAESVATKSDWAVHADDIVLGFFSFAKFLMYRDLDPENWPSDGKITDQTIVRALLSDGFEGGEALLSQDLPIDPHIAPSDMLHIVDSDSSQTLAVHDVRQGRDLVIQGPPGTGKSQTIANIIASAVADGKTVLFVAEKMAALDVVKRRLDHAGVGDACLELHSNKANKRTLLDELRRIWDLGSPRGEFPSGLATRLRDARDVLNGHAARMHIPHRPSGLTPYQVFGNLTRLRQEGHRPADLALETPSSWTPDDLGHRRRLLNELGQRVDEIGLPALHPWSGVGLDMVLPTTIERLVPRIDALRSSADAIRTELAELASILEADRAPATFADASSVRHLADVLADAPDFPAAALSAPVWIERPDDIGSLLVMGLDFERRTADLRDGVVPTAIDISIEGLEAELAWLPGAMPAEGFMRARALANLLPRLQADAERLDRELGSTGTIDAAASIARLVTTGERVAAAPDASPEAFAATVWDQGVEQAGDVAEAVAALEAARATVGDRFLDVAWTTEVAAARQALATHTGLFKVLSADYRTAKALVRSLMRNRNTPVAELVGLLDMLMKGQAAAVKIREGDAFGRSAFGADWRGERSESSPLLALVAWMRTLRGLGAEPRLIAGRLADRSEVGERSARVRRLLDEARPLLNGLWSDFGAMAAAALDDAASADHAPLDLVAARAEALIWADDLCAHLMRAVPVDLTGRLDLIRRVAAWQAVGRAIADQDDLGQAAFGAAWSGRASN